MLRYPDAFAALFGEQRCEPLQLYRADRVVMSEAARGECAGDRGKCEGEAHAGL